MTYSESAKGIKIDRQRALRELERHGCNDIEQFDAEVKPDKTGMYKAEHVLNFLGY